MSAQLVEIDAQGRDREQLIAFLSTNQFPFHQIPRPTSTEISCKISQGYYENDNRAFRVEDDLGNWTAVVHIEDLMDGPMLDIRVAERSRGLGIGSSAVRAATDYVFAQSSTLRFEGTTRADNVAMRRTFSACGWAQEAWYRQGWPAGEGRSMASVGYAILRQDWESGDVTPIGWD